MKNKNNKFRAFRVLPCAALIALITAFVGCFGGGQSGSSNSGNGGTTGGSENNQTVYYSIVFKEEGFSDVTLTVKEGEGVKTLPSFQGQAKTGYELVWDKTELSAVTENIVVNAIQRAKTYTISFDLGGGSMSVQSLTVTFGESYALPTPELSGFTFAAWRYNDLEIAQTGTWQTDGENIILVAVYEAWVGPF